MAKKKAGPKPANMGRVFGNDRPGKTGVPKFRGQKQTGMSYVPQGPGGRGTTDTNAVVRTGKKAKTGANEKAKRAASKGAKFYNAKTGKRVNRGDAWNPRTKDWRAGIRIEKGGNRMTTVGSEYH
jgi:hypothetical protein